MGFLALAVVLAGLIAWLVFGGKKPNKAPSAPVVAVATAKVTRARLPPWWSRRWARPRPGRGC
ncbi:MAG: hypothetical protein WDN45_12195 [Caulobacteraceae bacterium]